MKQKTKLVWFLFNKDNFEPIELDRSQSTLKSINSFQIEPMSNSNSRIIDKDNKILLKSNKGN